MSQIQIRVSQEALAVAASQSKLGAAEINDAQAHASHVLATAGAALDPTTRRALDDFCQAWQALGTRLSTAAEAAAESLSASAKGYDAVESVLTTMLRRAAP